LYKIHKGLYEKAKNRNKVKEETTKIGYFRKNICIFVASSDWIQLFRASILKKAVFAKIFVFLGG